MNPPRLLARLLVLVTLLLATSIVSPAPTARAAWNGQQIYISSAEGGVTATSLQIVGPNQNGSVVTYGAYFGYPGPSNYWVGGWWWKGKVQVTIGLAIANPGLSKTVTCYGDVPSIQSGSDWVRVSFNRYGCWKS
ncbi:hypothetical protein F8S13_06250 [Chloroflexia bacterium SDU3-3]|nr:hypothetical protein F8S13_06250 [Chloroflexia bacterium SDU3-3]